MLVISGISQNSHLKQLRSQANWVIRRWIILPEMKKWTFRYLLFLAATVSMALRLMIPMFPLIGSTFDDELMVWMTRNILDGKWVGNYQDFGHLILSKPPGYPLFLVATNWVPFSVINVTHALILGGAVLLIRELRFLGVSRNRSAIYFVAIVLYPPWFNEEMSRIYRDSFLALLSLYFIVCVLTLRRKIEENASSNTGHSIFPVIAMSAVCGGLIGWFIITKPSWHMLVGFLLLVYVSVGVVRRKNIVKVLLTSTASLGIIVLTSLPIIGSIVLINKSNYGVAVVDSFANGSFPRAMRAIYALPDDEDRPYVDVTHAMRVQGYEVSPTFKKLEKYLELPEGTGWRGVACGHKQLGNICDESGAWFPWDFRAAIEAAGLGKTAREFEQTSYQIAIELEDACEQEKLRCDSPGLAPGLDSLDSLDFRLVADAMFTGLGDLSNASFGLRERYSQSKEYPGASDLWPQTLNGFPRIEFVSNYEANHYALVNVRSLLAKAYQALLTLALILSVFGLLVWGRRGATSGESHKWKLLGVGSWLSVLILIFQVSLLEASSGLYMTNGGAWYLLPASPFFLLAMISGIERLSILVADRHSALKA